MPVTSVPAVPLPEVRRSRVRKLLAEELLSPLALIMPPPSASTGPAPSHALATNTTATATATATATTTSTSTTPQSTSPTGLPPPPPHPTTALSPTPSSPPIPSRHPAPPTPPYKCPSPACRLHFETTTALTSHTSICRHHISTLSPSSAEAALTAALSTIPISWHAALSIAQHATPALGRGALAPALLAAAASCDAPAHALPLLLARGADPNARDRYFATPLIRAARRGDAHAVVALLRAGARVADADRYGLSALHHAAAADGAAVEVGRILLEAGASLEAVSRRDRTPLDVAVVRRKSGEMLALLGG